MKPLVRLGERETAAYCVLRGIDYLVEECPMAAGNRHLGYKEALNAIEAASPGHEGRFHFGFLDAGAERFAAEAERRAATSLRPCARVRRADARRGLRVLPPGRAGRRRTSPVDRVELVAATPDERRR